MSEKNKRILIISVVVMAIVALAIIVFCNIGFEKIDDNSVQNEIIPEEEISDEQFRETTIKLFFINENNESVNEIVKCDSKELLNNPYTYVLNLLMQGPNDSKFKTAIPEGTRVNEVEKNGDCLLIDFSKEFVDNQIDDLEMHGAVINQIVNTVTQFTEINKVKISIDGKNDLSFNNGNINFEQIFTREF